MDFHQIYSGIQDRRYQAKILSRSRTIDKFHVRYSPYLGPLSMPVQTGASDNFKRKRLEVLHKTLMEEHIQQLARSLQEIISQKQPVRNPQSVQITWPGYVKTPRINLFQLDDLRSGNVSDQSDPGFKIIANVIFNQLRKSQEHGQLTTQCGNSESKIVTSNSAKNDRKYYWDALKTILKLASARQMYNDTIYTRSFSDIHIIWMIRSAKSWPRATREEYKPVKTWNTGARASYIEREPGMKKKLFKIPCCFFAYHYYIPRLKIVLDGFVFTKEWEPQSGITCPEESNLARKTLAENYKHRLNPNWYWYFYNRLKVRHKTKKPEVKLNKEQERQAKPEAKLNTEQERQALPKKKRKRKPRKKVKEDASMTSNISKTEAELQKDLLDDFFRENFLKYFKQKEEPIEMSEPDGKQCSSESGERESFMPVCEELGRYDEPIEELSYQEDIEDSDDDTSGNSSSPEAKEVAEHEEDAKEVLVQSEGEKETDLKISETENFPQGKPCGNPKCGEERNISVDNVGTQVSMHLHQERNNYPVKSTIVEITFTSMPQARDPFCEIAMAKCTNVSKDACEMVLPENPGTDVGKLESAENKITETRSHNTSQPPKIETQKAGQDDSGPYMPVADSTFAFVLQPRYQFREDTMFGYMNVGECHQFRGDTMVKYLNMGEFDQIREDTMVKYLNMGEFDQIREDTMVKYLNMGEFDEIREDTMVKYLNMGEFGQIREDTMVKYLNMGEDTYERFLLPGNEVKIRSADDNIIAGPPKNDVVEAEDKDYVTRSYNTSQPPKDETCEAFIKAISSINTIKRYRCSTPVQTLWSRRLIFKCNDVTAIPKDPSYFEVDSSMDDDFPNQRKFETRGEEAISFCLQEHIERLELQELLDTD